MIDVRRDFLEKYVEFLNNKTSFIFLKINHGFWDRLALIDEGNLWPKTQEERVALEKHLNLPYFFTTNYFDELMYILELCKSQNLSFEIFASVSAEPRKAGIKEKNPNNWVIEKYLKQNSAPELATIMKFACESGMTIELLKAMKSRRVVVVAPYLISKNSLLDNFENISYVNISFRSAYLQRWKVLEDIENELLDHDHPILLIQAGTLSVFWGTILALRNPNLTILDMGIALGAFAPEALISDPGVWQIKSGLEIFETTEELASLFAKTNTLDARLLARVAETSFLARQLSLPNARTGTLSSRLIEIKEVLNEIESQIDIEEAKLSAVKFWFSRALANSGEKEEALLELSASLSRPIKGFHLPQVAQIENYIRDKMYIQAIEALRIYISEYPSEIVFRHLGERISKLHVDNSFSEDLESWGKQENQVAGLSIFNSLPPWREKHGVNVTKIGEGLLHA